MAESIQELREICQKGKVKSFTDRIERRISIYFTKLLLQTNITANQTTLLDILIGLAACAFFVIGRPWPMLIGAILLRFWHNFDFVDGEIARYRKSSSLTGEYIDQLNHIIVEPLVFVCISFGLFRTLSGMWILALGFSASLSKLLGTLVQTNMPAVAMEAFLYPRRGLAKENRPAFEKSGFVPDEEYFATTSSAFWRVVAFMYFSLGKIWMIIIASVIDVLIPVMKIGNFAFNSMYVFLIIFGILSPFSWMGMAFLIIRHKSCERLYSSLLNVHNVNTGQRWLERLDNGVEVARE